MQHFEFTTAARILFGRGRFDEIGRLAVELGRKALIVSNADRSGERGLISRLLDLLSAESVGAEVFWIQGEPEIADVDRGVEAARTADCDLIVGIGGGSAIDTAKAVAGLLANGGTCLDYMEVIGEGRPIRLASTPWIAVPTTAGTGAEVTRNAVIGSKDRRYKASIRSPLLLPRVALVDAELALGVPRDVTARAGMDALTQCIESYTSKGANPMTDAMALEGISCCRRSLRQACENGEDLAAREEMALAALISGITLTNAGLGAVHGLAAPLGARHPVPHGTACAVLLPHVMRANIDELRRADPEHPALQRYVRLGRVLLGGLEGPGDDATDVGVEIARSLVRDLGLPGLGSFGVTDDAIPGIASMALKASSMKFNPAELSQERLEEAVRAAL
jgi:alcohol dehydrogenase class IV